MNGIEFFQLLESKSKQQKALNLRNYLLKKADDTGQTRSIHTIDFADILWKAQLWNSKLPNVDIFYAIKANCDPVLLKLFVLLGYSFDCSTEGEMRQALEAGADPSRIIFAHTIKTKEALDFASSRGIELMTFDNREELDKIKRHYPTANLLIRIKPDCPQCLMDLSVKYGCAMSDVKSLLLAAKDLGLNITGVSFHVGGLCEQVNPYVGTIRDCRKVFDIASDVGFDFEVLDIGAGFQGKLGTDDLFCQFAETIREAISTDFSSKNVRVIAEPGTFMVASAATVTTTVIGKRTLQDDQGVMRHDYYLNESIYGSFFNTICAYGIFPESLQKEDNPLFDSRLFGQTCCCEDVLLEKCSLPDLSIGDRVLWHNMGAYSRAICTLFTSVPFPDTVHVFKRNERLQLGWIKNVEKVADFIAANCELVV